jgi:tRNA (cmo5U34)-methyltransferase
MNESSVADGPSAGRHPLLCDPDAFDTEIRRFVPFQAEILDSLLESMLLAETDSPSVLELGCRTGLLSSRLIEEKPYVKLTAVEPEPAMVMACRERLGQGAGFVEIESRNIGRYSRPVAFDYVLSNLALHFLSSDAEKEGLCRNVFWSLKPGGMFAFSVMLDVNADEAGETIWKQWEREVLAAGTRRRDIEGWYVQNRRAYFPASRKAWLGWLQAAGFIHSELVWCENVFGTFWAKKPVDGPPGRISGLS